MLTSFQQMEWLTGLCQAQGIPIDGVAVSPLRIDYAPSATAAQKVTGNTILSTFNINDTVGYTTWKVQQSRTALKANPIIKVVLAMLVKSTNRTQAQVNTDLDAVLLTGVGD